MHRMPFTSHSKAFWKGSRSLSDPKGILPIGTFLKMADLNRFPGHREMKGQGSINKQLERTSYHPDVLVPNLAGAFAMCAIGLSLANLSVNYLVKTRKFKITEIKVYGFTADYIALTCIIIYTNLSFFYFHQKPYRPILYFNVYKPLRGIASKAVQ